MDSVKIDLEFELDEQSLKKETDKIPKVVKKSTDKAGKDLANGFSNGFKSGLKGINDTIGSFISSIGVVAAAFTAVVYAGSKFISSANQQEDAVNKLNNSLKRIGEFTPEASVELQNFASTLQSTTKFGDEAILGQIAFAQSMGATVDQSKSIIVAATDMSAALDIDLNSAVRNITKTLGGFAGELGEVIPQLKNLTKEQLQSGQGIDLLAAKYKGMAQGEITTASGALTQLGNSFGDLFENIGLFATKSETARVIIDGIKTSIDAINKSIGAPIETRSYEQVANELAQAIEDVEAAQAKKNGADVEAVKLFGVTIGLRNKASEGVKEYNEAILRQLDLEKELRELSQEDDKQLEIKRQKILASQQKERDDAMAHLQALGLMTNSIADENFAKRIETINNANDLKLLSEIEYNELLLAEEERFQAQKSALNKKGEDERVKFNEQINKQFGGIISSGTSTFIKNLIAGQNASESFKDFVLGSFGAMATQLGEFYVAQGIASMALFSADPTGTIAAGVGLIALGQLLSSFKSSGLAGAGQGGASVGTTIQDQSTTAISQQQIQEQAEPQTQVVVNIQGDVLDSNESGSRIVDLINNAVSGSGVTINRNALA